MCLSVSVYLLQVGLLSKRLKVSSWVLARKLPFTYPTLFEKEIRVSPKMRVLPAGTLPKTPDIESFALAYRSSKGASHQLSSTKMDAQRVINWTVFCQPADNTSELRRSTASLSQWSSSSVFSTIPSRGSISDSWYLLYCIIPSSAAVVWLLRNHDCLECFIMWTLLICCNVLCI